MDDRQEQFAEHFIRCQDRVYGFIVTMLPNRADAEEVFQQTSLILWRKWDEFAPASGADAKAAFVSWACGIARFEVLNTLRRADRSNVALSPDVMEMLAADRLAMDDELADRRAALEHCIAQLQPRQRKLVRDAYAGHEPINAIADRLGQSANALYLNLRRIRATLAQCITSRLAEEDA